MTHSNQANHCQTRHAIILAAGESTRTRPLTLHRPKPLIPLVGKPLLSHILDELVGLVEHVTLVVGYRAEAIQHHYGNTYRDMQIHYVHQHEINGTAGALLVVEDQAEAAGVPLNTPFFLLYGDNLISQVDLIGVCQQRYSLAGLHVDDPTAFGVLDIQHGSVQRIIEKPPQAPPDALANPGIYHFDGDVFPAVRQIEPSPRGEYELTDLIATLAAQHTVGYSHCRGHWIPVGNPWDVLVATAFLLERSAALRASRDTNVSLPDSTITGQVHIGNATIQSGCNIVGPAFIGDHVTIGKGCTIERSVIEEGATIGDECHIQHSIIGNGSTIGNRCSLQTSLLDNNTTLGDMVRLFDSVFDDVKPVSETTGLLSRETLCRRGVVLGHRVHIAARSTIAPGSVLFPKPS